MQNELKDRLKILIDRLNFNYKEFCKKTEIPYPTLMDYLSGKRLPGYENLKKLAMHLNISIDWLITGEGEMFIEKHKPLVTPETTKEYKSLGQDYILIPMVSGKISAGKGLVPVEDAQIEIKLAFRSDWIRRKGDHTKMSLIRVEGDSMEPTLFSGDIVLVDGNRNFVDLHGGIYAIYVNDSIMIKRIQSLFNEKKLKIISDNPKYEPIIVPPDNIHVIGKVIWIGREIEK